MARSSEASEVPAVIERFVKALVVTAKAVVLYPPASNIPLQTAGGAEKALREALSRDSELRLSVNKGVLLYLGRPLRPGYSAYESFALELYRRGLAEVRFHAGARARDIVAFLSVLKCDAEQVRAAGGFESRLWEQGVGTITVAEASFTVAGEPGEVGGGDSILPREELDELLAAAYSGRPREQVMIRRMLGEPSVITAYLSEVYRTPGDTDAAAAVGERLAELVEIAYGAADADERDRLLAGLGEAFVMLGSQVRLPLLTDHVLPEARTSEPMADFLRQLDVDEICRMLARDAADSDASREGLARALRALSLVSGAGRQDVLASAEKALRSEGLGDSFVSEVVALAAPTHVTQPGGADEERDRGPVESILRLVDLAPTLQTAPDPEHDPGLSALLDGARRGITDGDVMLALVDLVCIDPAGPRTASTMAMLEDALGVLVDRGEIDVAADAADALRAAASDPGLGPEQRERLQHAMRRLSRSEDLGAVVRTLRLHPPGSVEHRAAERLVDALGDTIIEPLLEQLAAEPDMGVRKVLIEVLSRKAGDHIPEFGAWMGDSRWYVVRNVVAILGSSRSSAILPYLEKAVRHPEPRVRRETIRALSGVHDRIASSMLVAMLSDEDEQNVLLAARYLGLSSVEAAVPALEAVARGEGRGNRGTGPRVEAIEALGKIGHPSALPTLRALAGKRTLRRGGAREIRTAAEAAMARIASGGGAA